MAARLQHMDDAADHPAVIDPRYSSRLVGQQRTQPLPLLVAQPELSRQITLHINDEGESHFSRRGNPVYESQP